MSRFGRCGGDSLEGNPNIQKMHATVRDIKNSPEKGCKRLIVQEKGTIKKPCAIDLDMKQLSKVKRKGNYSFLVEEKTEDRYGSGGSGRRTENFKRYYCSQKPEVYEGRGGSDDGFSGFSNSGRLGEGRTKFH